MYFRGRLVKPGLKAQWFPVFRRPESQLWSVRLGMETYSPSPSSQGFGGHSYGQSDWVWKHAAVPMDASATVTAMVSQTGYGNSFLLCIRSPLNTVTAMVSQTGYGNRLLIESELFFKVTAMVSQTGYGNLWVITVWLALLVAAMVSQTGARSLGGHGFPGRFAFLAISGT